MLLSQRSSVITSCPSLQSWSYRGWKRHERLKRDRVSQDMGNSTEPYSLWFVVKCTWIVTVGQLQRPQELLSQEAVVIYLIRSRTLDDCIWGTHWKMKTHHYFPRALLHFTSYFQTNIQSLCPSIFVRSTISFIWSNIFRKKGTIRGYISLYVNVFLYGLLFVEY